MILGFLNDLFGSVVLLSIVFLVAIIVEYRLGLIGQVVDFGNSFWTNINPMNWFQGAITNAMTNANINNNINNVDLNKFRTIQGFINPPIETVYEPSGKSESSTLSPGYSFSNSNEKLLSDFIPIQSDNEAQNAWSKIPSQTCLKHDDGEKLKPLANYHQRTNNYIRTNPDDCSAPFHEMLGTFYKPTLGVGQTAPSGIPLPGSVVSCDGSKIDIVGNISGFTKSISD